MGWIRVRMVSCCSLFTSMVGLPVLMRWIFITVFALNIVTELLLIAGQRGMSPSPVALSGQMWRRRSGYTAQAKRKNPGQIKIFASHE